MTDKEEKQGTITLTSKPTPIEFDRDDFTINTGGPAVEVPIPNQDTTKAGSAPVSEPREEFESDELRENSTKRPEASIEAEKEEFEKQGVVPEGAAEEEEEAKKRSEAAKKAAATRKKNEKAAAKTTTAKSAPAKKPKK